MASDDNVDPLVADRVSRIAALQFPMKLHVMLEESLKNGLDDIVSWFSTEGFRIYDRRRFESEIMPRYFKSTTHKVRLYLLLGSAQRSGPSDLYLVST
jgi:HSF-type DNA-binding